jgi:hypothetical protein
MRVCMKTPARRALSVVALTLVACAAFAADDKPAKPTKLTLEDVIFDAKYLKQVLGPKTLVATEEKTGKIPTEAITRAKLDEKTQIFTLPDEATKPQLISSIPPAYPQSTRLRRDPPKADFLLFIGTDGAVKCLYCYETKDEVFAILAADALIKWRYVPAKINGTAVPVILPVEMKFNESDAAIGTFNGPKPPLSLRGNPTRPPPSTPPGKFTPR